MAQMPPPLVDGLVDDVQSSGVMLARGLVDFARRLPGRVVAGIHDTASLLKALAIIGVFLVALAVLVLLYFKHPRATWISRAVDVDAYLQDAYFPHFIRALREVLGGATADPRTAPLVAQLRAALPADDDEGIVRRLTGYFRCYSHYTLNATGKDRFGFFPMPENGDTVTRAQHDALAACRAGLRAFAQAAPGDGLWVSQEDFEKRGAGAPWLRQAAAGSYDAYLRRAGAAARAVAGALELHLLLNGYADSIVVMFDARQRRLWGNPYIFHYFIAEQSRVTSDRLKKAWTQDYMATRRRIEGTVPKWYKSLGPVIARLPRTIAQMV